MKLLLSARDMGSMNARSDFPREAVNAHFYVKSPNVLSQLMNFLSSLCKSAITAFRPQPRPSWWPLTSGRPVVLEALAREVLWVLRTPAAPLVAQVERAT